MKFLIKLLKILFFGIMLIASITYIIESFLIDTGIIQNIGIIQTTSVHTHSHAPSIFIELLFILFFIIFTLLCFIKNMKIETHPKLFAIVMLIFIYESVLLLFHSGVFPILVFDMLAIGMGCADGHPGDFMGCVKSDPMFFLQTLITIILSITIIIISFICIKREYYVKIFNYIKESKSRLYIKILLCGLICIFPNIRTVSTGLLSNNSDSLLSINIDLYHIPFFLNVLYALWIYKILINSIFKYFKNKIKNTIYI